MPDFGFEAKKFGDKVSRMHLPKWFWWMGLPIHMKNLKSYHIFSSLNCAKFYLIKKLPYPHRKIFIDPNFSKMVLDLKIDPI